MVSRFKEVLDLEFLAPDAGGFVPVYFSQMNRTIRQSDPRNALTLAPTAAPIEPSQTGNFANFRASGEGLDVGNLAENLEAHCKSSRPLAKRDNTEEMVGTLCLVSTLVVERGKSR
jgi:hypothetical protein